MFIISHNNICIKFWYHFTFYVNLYVHMQCLSVIQQLVGVEEADHKLCHTLLERWTQFFQLFSCYNVDNTTNNYSSDDSCEKCSYWYSNVHCKI